ncbi:uncharacterized protein BDZ99DRAFT_481555 [Mytilinidion resinicola]|uniref:Uncharacterized protein n=1 Tax=Mytilinidion resinicola TaxID=574789 RepID=A0A6A6Y627_9PEZI|nr:uncharacterized protein BDZ99DRAFT_481555 [Mytilinidion resinicola]KAF2803978.1 hypothetical protein BDZ99DRAFT_481555 [Mytilinidion resinicola]
MSHKPPTYLTPSYQLESFAPSPTFEIITFPGNDKSPPPYSGPPPSPFPPLPYRPYIPTIPAIHARRRKAHIALTVFLFLTVITITSIAVGLLTKHSSKPTPTPASTAPSNIAMITTTTRTAISTTTAHHLPPSGDPDPGSRIATSKRVSELPRSVFTPALSGRVTTITVMASAKDETKALPLRQTMAQSLTPVLPMTMVLPAAETRVLL